MTDEHPRINLVYAGRVGLASGKVGQMFYRILDEEKQSLDYDHPYLYGKFKTAFLVVGGVHTVEYDETTADEKTCTVYPSSVRFESMWPNKTAVDEWVARDRTLVAAKESARLRSKMIAENDDLGKMLTRLHGMYLSLPVGPQKSAFLTMVHNAVMRG